MTGSTDKRRFRIPEEASATVHVHAALAVKRIRSLELYLQGYTERLAAFREQRTGRPPAPVLPVQLATIDQLEATRRDLVQLAQNAQETGTEALKQGNPSPEPKIDLMEISGSTPEEMMATVYVIRDRIMREARDAADQLARLIEALDNVADAEVLLFAGELGRLAKGLRPPGAPPGPYAPKQQAA